MHDDLYQYLSNDAAIAALFPGGIHHMSLPQDVDEWPAMAFQLVAELEIADDMESPNDAKIDQANYQFAITADNSTDAVHAGNDFGTIFRNFRGTMGSTRVQFIALGNKAHLEERIGDKLRRRVVLDFSITFDV